MFQPQLKHFKPSPLFPSPYPDIKERSRIRVPCGLYINADTEHFTGTLTLVGRQADYMLCPLLVP